MLKDMFFEDDEDFYSHAREGRDFRGVLTQDPHQSISTHTPARGVTSRPHDLQPMTAHFYSHAREGRDGERLLL